MKNRSQQTTQLGRSVIFALVWAALLLPGQPAIAEKSSPVLSVKISADRLVVIAIQPGKKVLDGTFKTRSGHFLVFDEGKLVKATDTQRHSRDVDKARIDPSGKLVIGSGKAEWKVEEGEYLKQQGGRDPQPEPEPQPQPNPNGFKVSDGKIVAITLGKDFGQSP